MPKKYSPKRYKQTANIAKEPETSYCSVSALYEKEIPAYVKRGYSDWNGGI